MAQKVFSPNQTAISHIVRALTKPSKGNGSPWIAYAVSPADAEAMGVGGLEEIFMQCINLTDTAEATKMFLTRTLKLTRGPHGKGIYYFYGFEEDGSLTTEPEVVYKTVNENSGPPWVNLAWRDPDDAADMSEIKKWLEMILPGQLKDNSGDLVDAVCAKLRLIKTKGKSQMKERQTSRPKKFASNKADPSKRSLPVIYQEKDPEARRMKAAGEAVLADAKGAQTLVDLGEFLREHFDMSKLVKKKNRELTPR